MMNAKIAPKSDDTEKESTDKKEKKEEEETKKEEQDFLTRKCGWLCCGLCTDTYKKKRPEHDSTRDRCDDDQGRCLLG